MRDRRAGDVPFRVVTGELDSITEHASPEAIHQWLIVARRNLYAAQDEVEWLEDLLERRIGEKRRGEWPRAGVSE